MFISMLLTYSYYMGARRRWWMPFRTPFATAGERVVENTSSSRIKLIKWLFYRFIPTQRMRPRPTPSEEVNRVWSGVSKVTTP